MDPEADPAKAAQVAQQIVKLLAGHNLETRHRAISAAMALLGHPAAGGTGSYQQEEPPTTAAGDTTFAEFFNRGENLKPADYAQLCAAFHYSLHGPVTFSLDDIRTIGAEAGVVLPDRLDKTFKAAAHHGKKLFQTAGRAAFKPTASAGLAFVERWGVKPGRPVKLPDSQKIVTRS